MPRAAMSVATSARIFAARKAASACSRCDWLLLPWMAATRMPAASRCRATLSAPRLVRVNTSARVICGSPNSSTSSARLLLALDVQHALRDAVDRRRRRSDRDPDRIAQQLVRQLADLARHGRGEEQVLPLRRELGDDAADRRQEAEVQHLVGLVEHQHLGARQHDAASRDVVEQPAGRRDQHVDAARQRLDLRPVADAAEHDRHGEAEMPAVGAEAFRDLAGELARRREHQHAAALAQRGPAVGGEAMQDRQGECGRLAGAGLGDAQQVAAGQHARYGLRLDGRGRGVAFVLQRLENRRGKAEFGKVRQWIGLSCGRAHIGCVDTAGRPAAPSAASFFETPRVSWAVGWEFSGRSTGGQIGRTGPDTCPSRGWSAQIAHSSGDGLSHVAAHKSRIFGRDGSDWVNR